MCVLLIAKREELCKEKGCGSNRYVMSAFAITAFLLVVLAFWHYNYVHVQGEKLPSSRQANTKGRTSHPKQKPVNDHIIIDVTSTHLYTAFQRATRHLAALETLALKPNVFQKKESSFHVAMKALDKPSFPPSSKTVFESAAIKSKHKQTISYLPTAHLGNSASAESIPLMTPRKVKQPRSTGAPRISGRHHAAHPEPAQAPPTPAAAASASALSTPRQAAADRLATLQDFLRTIEELDQAH